MAMVRSKYGETTQEEYLRRKAEDTEQEKEPQPIVKNTIAYELSDCHMIGTRELNRLVVGSIDEEAEFSCFRLSKRFGKLGFSSNLIATYTEDFGESSSWAVKPVRCFTGEVMGIFQQLAKAWLKEDGYCAYKASEMVLNLNGWSPENVFPDYCIDGFKDSENLTFGFLNGESKSMSREAFEKQRDTNVLAKFVYETCDTFEKLGITVGRVRFCIHGSVGMDFSRIAEYKPYIGVGNIFKIPYSEYNNAGDKVKIVSDEYEVAYILYADPKKNSMSVSFLRDCAEACDAMGLSDEQLIEIDKQRLASDPFKFFRFDEAVEKMKG